MTTQFAEHPRTAARWEHFSHEADVGVRGVGPDMASAFVQAAIAMSAVITEPQRVLPQTPVDLAFQAPDPELLLFDWLNALVYAMATRHMLFSQFRVDIDGTRLRGSACGESVDTARHQPRVEIKGATFTELRVDPRSDGLWLAQCVAGRITPEAARSWIPVCLPAVPSSEWHIEPHDRMRVPGIIYASEDLIRNMDHKVYEQVVNVATLPGIVKASYAMPDAHWGYGFPIGGVAAFDAGRRRRGLRRRGRLRHLLRGPHPASGLTPRAGRKPASRRLADALFVVDPGRRRQYRAACASSTRDMDAMLPGGARWAVQTGLRPGSRIWSASKSTAAWPGADPTSVSERAKKRQRDEMGTLGSGNHYLEVQEVAEVYDAETAAAFGSARGRSRGQHPLRLARPGAPDRHRVPAEYGDCRASTTAFSCRTANWPARRSNPRSARRTWARCAPASIAPWPTARSSPI